MLRSIHAEGSYYLKCQSGFILFSDSMQIGEGAQVLWRATYCFKRRDLLLQLFQLRKQFPLFRELVLADVEGLEQLIN